MYKSIRIAMILGLFTSCMQVNLKDKLSFDGQDSSTVNHPNDDVEVTYETQFIGTRSMNVRYGDYKFMTTSLMQKYGPSCQSTINTNIWNQYKVFGAVCDIYDTTESCNNSNQANPLVLTSTMRAGRVIKTCEEIAMNNSCVSYFLGEAGLSASSTLNSKNLLKAYNVFYPLSDTLSEEQELAFLNLGDKFTNNNDKWKAVSLALCVSPEWQIP